MGENKTSDINDAHAAIQAARVVTGATNEQAKAIELRGDD